MTHPALADWTNALGGAAVVGLGLFVFSVRPRTVATVSFATFAVGFGGHFLSGNAAAAFHRDLPLLLMILEFLVWTVGAVLMALTFPRAVSAADRGPVVVAAAVMLAVTLSGFWGFSDVLGTSPAGVATLASSMLAEGSLGGYLVLLALRFRRSPDPEFRRQAVLTAAAITMYLGFIAGFGRGGDDGLLAASGPILTHALVRVALLASIAALWLAAMRGADARTARNMAWLTLTMPLVGLIAHAMGQIEGGHGVTRIAMVAILAYAILRHRLLGLDVKVRWTISKSTVAAVFVAAFFIASEGAQIFFGQGNEWVGLLAAGALVFALAPLQRAAERLAEKAVPSTTAPSNENARREEIYRQALRIALMDRQVSRAEDVHLFQLADELGIRAGRAMTLRQEIEAEQQEVPT